MLEDYQEYLQQLFEPSSINMNHAALLSEFKTQMAQVRITADPENFEEKYMM